MCVRARVHVCVCANIIIIIINIYIIYSLRLSKKKNDTLIKRPQDAVFDIYLVIFPAALSAFCHCGSHIGSLESIHHNVTHQRQRCCVAPALRKVWEVSDQASRAPQWGTAD